jgi:hypothetical protein
MRKIITLSGNKPPHIFHIQYAKHLRMFGKKLTNKFFRRDNKRICKIESEN